MSKPAKRDPRADVVQAARAWFRSKRPAHWDRAKHLKNPTVNVDTCAERDLAMAVAGLDPDVQALRRALDCALDGREVQS